MRMHERSAMRATSLPPSEVQSPAPVWQTRLHETPQTALVGDLTAMQLNKDCFFVQSEANNG